MSFTTVQIAITEFLDELNIYCIIYTHVINSLPVVDPLPGLQWMLPEKVIVLRTSHPQVL